KLALDNSGDVVVTTAAGELRLRKPTIYQMVNGQRKEVSGVYSLKRGNEISFVLGPYDHSRELTIDPVLLLSTYLADAVGVSATGVAADSTGIYVTGNTQAAQFSTFTNTLTQNPVGRAGDDVFVVKLDPSGNHLIYSAIIGGNGAEDASSIAID